jgi:tetratricopeptide (TPR) repeat protein
MDGELFYQVLMCETKLRQNDAGFAYQIYLELARNRHNAQLYQRSVDIALGARAGDQALAAARAWHTAFPQDRQASEYTAQILMALGRTSELAQPLRDLIAQTPKMQQPQMLGSLTRSLNRISDRKAVAQVVDEVTQPWRDANPGLAEAWAASSEAWLNAGDHKLALDRMQRADALDPRLSSVGLLAIDLMPQHPQTEAIVKRQLAQAPTTTLRLAYARKLLTLQRLPDAAAQLDIILAQQPDIAMAWLTLGAVRVELKQLDLAEVAVQRFLALASAQANLPADDPKADPNAPALDIDQGYLRMAQISEMRKQLTQADEWLRKADPKGEKINVQMARARMLVGQGKLNDARALIQAIPEAEPRDALVKINSEAQILREARQYDTAFKLLGDAVQRFPEESDLLYDQAMLAEALKRHSVAEALLRKVIAMRPDHPNAYNALGYSLADRGLQLDEARSLILKALELRPGDPYITDSLGWVEFRAGQTQEALKWLRQAYVSKSDSEIAAHLGEVLWTLGQKEEALSIWREGLTHDPENEALQSTLKRLQVKP